MSQRRTPEEIKRSFEMAKKMGQRAKKKENEISVKYAKNALIVLAIIQALVATYYISEAPWLTLNIFIEAAIGATFLGLYFYAKNEPVRAFMIAIIVYGAIILIMAAVNFATIFTAIFLKAIVIAILVTGLTAAKKLPKPKPEITDDLLDDDL